ncbi:MAG: hypothetical protein ACRCS9_04450 [Hyphomicrobium sp.]
MDVKSSQRFAAPLTGLAVAVAVTSAIAIAAFEAHAASSTGAVARGGLATVAPLVHKTALGTGCRTAIGVFRLNLSGPKRIGARCCGHPPQTGGRRICGVVVR